MLHIIEREYYFNTTRRLNVPTPDLISFVVPVDGEITEITVVGNSGSGTSTFSVKLNGIDLYAGVARPSIVTTEAFGTKTGLSDSVSKFVDRITLDLVEITGSGLTQRLTLLVTIDDGVPDAVGVESVVAGTNVTVDNTDPANPVVSSSGGGGGGFTPAVIFDDPCTGGTIDSAIWGTVGAGASQSGGEIQITATSTEHIKSANAYKLLDKQVSAKVPSPYLSSANVATQLLIASSDSFSPYTMIQILNNLIEFYVNSALVVSLSYDAVNDVYIRLRWRYRQVLFQTSPDGVNWISKAVTLDTNDTSWVSSQYIYLRQYNASGVSRTSKWDNIKLENLALSET